MTLSRSGEAARRERIRLRRLRGQTTCSQGHDLTLPRAVVGRQCRECHKERMRDRYRKQKAAAPTTQTQAARKRMLAIDAELEQQLDLQARADGPQNREIKARILALRNEKDSLEAMLRKTTGEQDE